MQNNIGVSNEQARDRVGKIYKVSGGLFIVSGCSKSVPKAFTGVRGNVVGFSPDSGRRMRSYLRTCRAEYDHMVTLTYPFSYPSNGSAVKEHLRRFLQEVRREYHRFAVAGGRVGGRPATSVIHSSFWFLEFQQRGAPHFHIFTTWSPSKEWIAKRWYEICGTEDVRHLHAGTRTEKLNRGRAGTISYASKYANKAEQKEVPANYENVGRFWGVYGDRVTVSAATFVSARDNNKERVQKVVTIIRNVVLAYESSGEIVRLKTNNGNYVGVMQNARVQRALTLLVCRLTSLTMCFDDMFIGAELDDGECLQ